MAYHRIYRYTSVGRPLKPDRPSHKAVLILMPLGALAGAVQAGMNGGSVWQVLHQALYLSLIVYGSWALAREMDTDDPVAAFISMAACVFAALLAEAPAVLIVFTTLGLARVVNRSSGLTARKSDSAILLLLVLVVMYATESPFYGIVAGLAFVLDGSLRNPLRSQWVFGMICFAATIVYLVDHDAALSHVAMPVSLFGWLSLLFLAIFALNTLLLKSVQATGDANGKPLDPGRVRAGMAVGILAALQGLGRHDEVVILVAVIAGVVFGMAFRKGFRVPTSAGT